MLPNLKNSFRFSFAVFKSKCLGAYVCFFVYEEDSLSRLKSVLLQLGVLARESNSQGKGPPVLIERALRSAVTSVETPTQLKARHHEV